MSPLAFLPAAASVPAQINPETEACGPAGDRGWLCSTVFDVTDNERAAEIADAFAKPVRVVLILLVAWIVTQFVGRVIRRLVSAPSKPNNKAKKTPFGFIDTGGVATARRAQRAKTMADVLGRLANAAIWGIAVLVALGELGINLAPLIAGAGVLGIALGFGAQSLVRDFISGFFMLVEDQYGVGDVIDVGGVVGGPASGVSGTVEGVSLRTTRLRDVEGVVWHVPNGEIKRVGNKSQQWSRALLDIEIDRDTDIATAINCIKQTADAMWHDEGWRDAILQEPDVWGVEELRAQSMKIRLVVQTLPLEQWRVARELRARVKAALDEAGIETPRETITYRRGDPPPPADEEH
ncbi:MAG TPA: mechanosensitive ion channel family protein [Acidimicrobiia bacterium]|nr:mechanosensitive ion channel family protein [Acidimicrobiia bacterium]